MIEEAAAVLLATELLGRQRNDAESPWDLEEFVEGWLIREQLRGRGAASKVIEKSSGKIRFFPSRIAPDLIVEEYESVVDTAREVSVSDIQP